MATSLRFPVVVERPPRAPLRTPSLDLPSEGPRRALNVAVAALGLTLALPLMAVIAALIKLTSPGPVLFRQVRVGLDRRGMPDWPDDAGGAPFTMYKFRTMRAAPAGARAVWASPNDARVTAIGKVLRRYRLDELPQLWNVLVGDMNIVGPRPEQPAIFVNLRRSIPRYSWRQRVRPGITGLAQVNLPPDQNVNDVRRKLALDLEYIRQAGFWGDLRIMLQTPAAMFGRRLGW
jgi:lipopolysaccharide/colanic/teichoic acid biosynthesis glycosyltransferase